MSVPQVIVTLSPSGDLIAELPGLNGSRRKINLTHSETKETETEILLRILNAQLTSKSFLGEDGSPTQAQILHWERHGDICKNPLCKTFQKGIIHSHSFSDPSCTFCKSEGRFDSGKNREKSTLKGLSFHQALELGLISRGYQKSKNNPDLFLKGKLVLKLFDSKIQNQKDKIFWSKAQINMLLEDGKAYAKTNGFTPQDTKPKKLGNGVSVKKLVKKLPQKTSKLGTLSF